MEGGAGEQGEAGGGGGRREHAVRNTQPGLLACSGLYSPLNLDKNNIVNILLGFI